MAMLTLASALSDHEKRRRHEHKYRGKGRRHRSSLSSRRAAQSSKKSKNTTTKWEATTTTKKSRKTTSTKKSTKTAAPTTTTTTKKSSTTTLTTKKASQTSSSSGGSSGGKYSGEGTYYDVGLGSCGQTDSNSQFVAALNAPQMKNGDNPNNNPQCGKKIKVTNPANGKSVTVKLVDTCPPCASGDVDLSPSAFAAIADMDLGRIPIKWDWV